MVSNQSELSIAAWLKIVRIRHPVYPETNKCTGVVLICGTVAQMYILRSSQNAKFLKSNDANVSVVGGGASVVNQYCCCRHITPCWIIAIGNLLCL